MSLNPLNSVAGFSIGETPVVIISANGDINTNNLTTTGVANLNSISNVKITGGTTGQVIQTDGNGNLSFTTVDTWRIQNGTSNVQIATSGGNVTVTVAGNANIATFTSSGANISGYLTVQGNITANGNISANNYIVTPASRDLIVAPATNLVRVDGDLNPFNDNTYDLGNNLARWGNIYANVGNFAGTLDVTGNAKVGGLLTNNLYYANGQPWDLQAAAGANYEIQFNIDDNFAASANFTYNDTTQLLTVLGNAQFNNANLGNLATANFVNVASNVTTSNLTVNLAISGNTANFTGNIKAANANLGNLVTANFVSVSSNVTSNNVTVNLELQANTANFDGNVVMDNWLTVSNIANVGTLRTDNLQYANGTPWDLQEAAGSNNYIQYNVNNNFAASANFQYNDATQQLTLSGNANITNTLKVNQIQHTGILGQQIIYANGSSYLVGSNNFIFNDSTSQFTVNGNAQFNNANLGNLATANFVNVASNIVSSNLTVNVELQANNANFDGNVVIDKWLTVSNTASVANLSVTNNVTTNLVPSANITYNLGSPTNQWNSVYAENFVGNISGNISAPGANTQVIFNDEDLANAVANFTYNKTANSNGGRLNVGNTVGGEITTDGFYAKYANIGNIDVITEISTFDLTASNSIVVTGSGGDLTMTGGDITGVNDISANTANFANTVIANSLTVNLNIAGNTANFTGNISSQNANLGNLATANYVNVANDINAIGNITGGNLIGALANGNSNVKIYGNANVEISIAGSANVATFSGNSLFVVGNINTTAGSMLSNGNVTANSFLNSANANVTGEGQFGSVKTANIIATSGNITISAAGSDKSINLVPTGNGVVDVANARITNLSTPTSDYDAATKKYVDDLAQGLNIHDACYAATANTLTVLTGGGTITYNNGTGGVGANLVLSGTYSKDYTTANTFDGNTTATTGSRILVKNEANAAHNGIYVVTSATVLTRADDYNTVPEVEAGDFTFVQDGDTYNDTGWVQTSTVTTIGTDPIVFTQFSGAGTYTAGSGLTLTGSVFSVNVDNVTTAISNGNVVIKTGANLTTPNIGDATFSSLSWNNLSNGNVTANNLSISNIANITGAVTLGNTLQVNSTISSNANVSGANLTTTGNVQAGGNVLAGNITANATVFASNANVSGTAITNALTVNNAITGNTANFSGNVVVPNLTVNLALAGNTANFSGNVVVPNLAVNLELAGNTANFSGNVVVPNLTVNLALAGNTANFTGNITAANANLGNLATANFFTGTLINGTSNVQVLNNGNINLTAAGNTTLVVTGTSANVAGNLKVTGNATVDQNLVIGNTTITTGTVTTSAITANQTISSFSVTGVTGIEFLVKAVDSTGSKYSVATVQAVTDGTNVDYSVYGTVQLGGYTGSLAVNIVSGNVALQVTPASSNSTVWTTQYRLV